jgi:predicted aspartyl protease
MSQVQGTFDPNDPKSAPIVTVEVSYPISSLPAGSVPKVRTVRLLVDTGASGTMISKLIADALSLDLKGQREVKFGSNTIDVDVFQADLRFPNTNISFSDMKISELPNPSQIYDGVLGREILNQCSLFYDGTNGLFTLTF